MARLTITLSDEIHRGLKEAAVRRGKSIRELVEASLVSFGIKSHKTAAQIVAAARKRASMTEVSATRLAVRETRARRRE